MMTYRFANRWPSLSVFAADIGVEYETAKGIDYRERHGLGIIPDRYWLRAVSAAKKRKIPGVTLTSLAQAAEGLALSRRGSSEGQRAA